MNAKIQTYRFDYWLSVPVRGAGFHQRRGRKQAKGYGAVDAARRLRRDLSRKWADPVRVVIEGGIAIRDSGFIPLNPDILPEINHDNP